MIGDEALTRTDPARRHEPASSRRTGAPPIFLTRRPVRLAGVRVSRSSRQAANERRPDRHPDLPEYGAWADTGAGGGRRYDRPIM